MYRITVPGRTGNFIFCITKSAHFRAQLYSGQSLDQPIDIRTRVIEVRRNPQSTKAGGNYDAKGGQALAGIIRGEAIAFENDDGGPVF
jgi:hypothetical protein